MVSKEISAKEQADANKKLKEVEVTNKTVTYEANHTFMRDDGYRYDPVATDAAWGEITTFLKGVLN